MASTIAGNARVWLKGLVLLAGALQFGCSDAGRGRSEPVAVKTIQQALPATEGQWEGPICWPHVAVHVVHLHTGKILSWPNTGSTPDALEAWVWDAKNPNCFGDQGFPDPSCFQRVDNNETNLFCAGHAALQDGRILTVGGHDPAIGNHNGLTDANLFDPETETWAGEASGLGQMTFRRWYPTSTTLGDGRIITVAGSDRHCFGGSADGAECHSDLDCPGGSCVAGEAVEVIATPEMFDAATGQFTPLSNALLPLPIYAGMYLLPDGRLFFAGAEGIGGGITVTALENYALDIPNQSWSLVATSNVPGASSAMYEPGKVLKIGGQMADGTTTNGAEVIDLTSTGSGAWRDVQAMAAGRIFSNLTLLPDGTVMVSGGTRSSNREYNYFCEGGTTPGKECSPAGFPEGRPGLSCPMSNSFGEQCFGGGTCTAGDGAQQWVEEVQIFDPATETWTSVANNSTPRQYHSSTVLLPDGRVVSSGGGQGSGAIHDYATIDIFSPPYLFKGPRPTVTAAPLAVGYGQTFGVTTPDASAIASASLIRLAVTTHGTDQNARFVPLTFQAQAGSVQITGARVGGQNVALSPNIAPPGYYMLFLVSTDGVPSIGKYIRVGDGPLAICKDVTVNVDSGTCSAANVSVDDGSFDPGGTQVTLAQSPPPPYGLGANSVVLTATDGNGLSDVCHATVTVVDNEPPRFTSVPADLTTTTCASPNLGTATASDVCGGTVTITNDAPAQFVPGTTVVTWTATDERGNVTTATQRVTLVLTDNAACCPAGTNVIQGNSNNNFLNGTAGPDCILGRGGQDTINGLGGNDFISGGDGNDTINAGGGNDVVFGGSGQDPIVLGSGNDTAFGGDGDDNIQGDIGDDTLRGDQGQDVLQGQDGNDSLFGDDGDDNVQGGNGNDSLVGGTNNDTCNGGTGTNTFAQCEFGAPNSCLDGATNGTETGPNCGGACPGCGVGNPCISGSDCSGGNFCVAGACRAPAGGGGPNLIQTQLTFSTDWGGGYCAVLNVTNNAAQPTTGYTVTLDTNASTIYTSWNGNFSGANGTVTVTPGFSWNVAIPPGSTDSSIGFCANRAVSGSGTLPFVISTTATY